MAGSNEGNEGNEGNVGNAGRGFAGGASAVLPDRVDLPFITEDQVAKQRVAVQTWNERQWDREWAAWLMLGDFVEAARLPRARPNFEIKARPRSGNSGNGKVTLDLTSPVAPDICVGTYRLECISASGIDSVLHLLSPHGRIVDEIRYRTGIPAPHSSDFSFRLEPIGGGIADTNFASGDRINIFVSAVDDTGQGIPWVSSPASLSKRRPLTVRARAIRPMNGNGTCRPLSIADLAGIRREGYRAVCTNVSSPQLFTFELRRPNGAVVHPFSSTVGGPAVCNVEVGCAIEAGSDAFVAGDTFELTVEPWDELEIRDLIRLAEDERTDALSEIVAQNESFQAYFFAALGITPKSHPNTALLLQIGALVGAHVSMHFKGLYQRPRPSNVAPGLMPPIPVPGHPAYPSGHSTQAHLMALCAIEALKTTASGVDRADELGTVLMTLAGRIARNREIAGLHFASDTTAGIVLAEAAFALLDSHRMPDTVPQPQPPSSGPAPTLRRFAEIVRKARGEW